MNLFCSLDYEYCYTFLFILSIAHSLLIAFLLGIYARILLFQELPSCRSEASDLIIAVSYLFYMNSASALPPYDCAFNYAKFYSYTIKYIPN